MCNPSRLIIKNNAQNHVFIGDLHRFSDHTMRCLIFGDGITMEVFIGDLASALDNGICGYA